MQKHKLLPFTYKGVDIQDNLCITYYDVVFTDNFGQIQIHDQFSCIEVKYSEGIIDFYNVDGSEIIKKQNFFYFADVKVESFFDREGGQLH